MTISIKVPGKVWHDSCDPNITSVPEEESWPEPSCYAVGKGEQFVYHHVDDRMAANILSHIFGAFECRQGYEEAAHDRAPYLPFLRRYAAEYGRLLHVAVP